MNSETEIDLPAMRTLLLARRDDLRDLWRKNMTAEDGLVDDREPDWEDLASLHAAADRIDRLGDMEVDELRQIVRAVDKIDAGGYAVCERCGEPIRGERLQALPQTPWCSTCATELEASRELP